MKRGFIMFGFFIFLLLIVFISGDSGICDGCSFDERCIPYGNRLVFDIFNSIEGNFSLYCDYDGEMKEQKLIIDGNFPSCQNSFECESNVCSNGKCVDFKKEFKETESSMGKLGLLLCSIANPFSEKERCECERNFLSEEEKVLVDCEDDEPVIEGNVKNPYAYDIKQVFLISDKNWQDVLSLVPVTTWTQQEGDDSECQRGYGTPENVCVYPTLIYHEENFTNKTIELGKDEFIKNTGLFVSWNFKDNVLAESTVDSDEFTILFELSDDMYDKMNKGILRGDLDLVTSKIDSKGDDEISYDIFFNGQELDKYVYFDDERIWIQGVFWEQEKYLLKKGTNNLIFKRTGGNIAIEGYKLSVPYFATDSINDDCIFEGGDSTIYDLCIKDVQLNKKEIFPGEEISYSIIIENIGDEVVDLSGEDIEFQGAWNDPSTLGQLYKVPYDLVLSHLDTSIQEVKLESGQSTQFDIKLIYNESINLPDQALDADSIIYFMQQYNTEKVIVVGETPQELDNLLVAERDFGSGLERDNIQRINSEDVLSYWASYEDVVYVEEDYELGLMASTYASLLNVPLIIQGTELDKDENFEGRKIICVGNVDRNCDETYTLNELQQKYVDETNTDKVILVNPNDLEIKKFNKYETDKSQEIVNLFSKNSLTSPILASAKNELIIPIKSRDYQEADNIFTSKLHEYYDIPEHKKIICSGGDSCSDGFEEKTKQIYSVEDRLIYVLPDREYSTGGRFFIDFGGNFYDCEEESVQVELYNNGNLLASQRVNCNKDVNSVFSGYSGFGFYEKSEILSVSPGSLELRFEGAKFALNQNHLFSIYFIENEENLNFVFRCESAEDDCAPNVNLEIIRESMSEGISLFNFNNLDSSVDYLLLVNLLGEGIESASIYVNDNLVGNFDWVSSIGEEKGFKISKDLIEDNMQVKILPLSNSRKDNAEILYFAEVSINSILTLPYFLTIFASPDAIPMYRTATLDDDCGFASRVEADGRIYGSLDNYGIINLPVGRIMGVSSSDVSGYVARDLFFNELDKNKDAILVVYEDAQDEVYELGQEISFESCREEYSDEINSLCGDMTYKECNVDYGGEIYNICGDIYLEESQKNGEVLERYAKENFWTPEIRNEFDTEYFYSGHEEVEHSREDIYGNYADPFLKSFNNHGWPGGFAGMMDSDYLDAQNIYLKPSLVIGLACSTCHYSGLGTEFCVQGIRRGALAQQGAVDVSYWHQQFDDIYNGVFLEDKTIGEAYLEGRNEDYFEKKYNFCSKLDGDPYYALLGDPTWRPKWW